MRVDLATSETLAQHIPDGALKVAESGQAVADGADWLVIGRPLRDALDPGAAADAIAAELDQG